MPTKVKSPQTDLELLAGWFTLPVALTYSSATVVNASIDLTTYIQKGDKIRFKQGAGYKYGYIIAISSTQLTITGGSDYTIVNASITDIWFSKVHTPQGFPVWMNYAVSWLGNSGVNPDIGNGVLSGKFKIDGVFCEYEVNIVMGSTTTYGSGGVVYIVGLPLSSADSNIFHGNAWISQLKSPYGQVPARHRGTWLETSIIGGAGYVYANAPFTFGATDQISIKGRYIY